jgi:glycosyltransferase involved in cell wall biosynthesis
MSQPFPPYLSKGINLIGHFGKCLGLAQSARLIISSLQKQSIPFSLISEDSWASAHPTEHFPYPITNEFIYPVNLFCLDPNHNAKFVEKIDWNCVKDRYNIALYFWETNRLPKKAKGWWYYLDEIWTPTHYVHEHISIASPIPIYRIPLPVELPRVSENMSKENFNLKNRFTFLFYFSFFSILNRKNPLAIVQAFKKAFPNRQDVQLVIKSQNGHHFPDQLKGLLKEIDQDSRIVWLDQTMDAQACFDLMNVCDCYISLHRSEGFGLTMAEAMLLEKPVIATGYSGNLDFMNEENSFLCLHQLVPIGKGNFYPPKGVWADVDIDHAAFLMNHVFYHPAEAHSKGQKGKEYILKHHSCEVVGQHISWRLNKIPSIIPSKPQPWKHKKKQLWHQIKLKIKTIIGINNYELVYFWLKKTKKYVIKIKNKSSISKF